MITALGWILEWFLESCICCWYMTDVCLKKEYAKKRTFKNWNRVAVFAKEPSTSSIAWYPSDLPIENRKPSDRLMETFLSKSFEKISIANLFNKVLFQFLSSPSLPRAPEAPAASRRPPKAHHHHYYTHDFARHPPPRRPPRRAPIFARHGKCHGLPRRAFFIYHDGHFCLPR